jgi:hypothetical protein
MAWTGETLPSGTSSKGENLSLEMNHQSVKYDKVGIFFVCFQNE